MKKPYLAGGLSLLHPGLGQIYNGDFEKGMVYAYLILLGSIFDIIGIAFLFGFWVLVAVADIIIWLIGITEAICRSTKINSNNKPHINEFKKKNLFKRLFYYAIIVVIVPLNLTIHIYFGFWGIPALLSDTGGLNFFQ
jgi:hypothetical protein